MSQISTLINRLQAEPFKLSQSEITRRTGIPQPRISRWGAGSVAAGADDALKLVALAKSLGMDVEQCAEGAPALPAPEAKAVA